MHKRRWVIANVGSIDELAEKLTDYSWTLCTGFQLGAFLFLNDATSEDGAQEYAVVKEPESERDNYLQVESITFSWCTKEQAREYIAAVTGATNESRAEPESGVCVARSSLELVRALGGTEVRPVVAHPQIQTLKEHGTCELCA